MAKYTGPTKFLRRGLIWEPLIFFFFFFFYICCVGVSLEGIYCMKMKSVYKYNVFFSSIRLWGKGFIVFLLDLTVYNTTIFYFSQDLKRWSEVSLLSLPVRVVTLLQWVLYVCS
jgi:hypothetical protein